MCNKHDKCSYTFLLSLIHILTTSLFSFRPVICPLITINPCHDMLFIAVEIEILIVARKLDWCARITCCLYLWR